MSKKGPKPGNARSRLKTHHKSQMGRSKNRSQSRIDAKLDRGESFKHNHNRGIIDRVKPYPEMVKEYSSPTIITPSRANPGAVKAGSGLVHIIVQFPATVDRKAGAARICIGFRVTMMDGSSWFYHFKFGTWTRTIGVKKDSFGSTTKLFATMAHCKPLLDVLSSEFVTLTKPEKK